MKAGLLQRCVLAPTFFIRFISGPPFNVSNPKFSLPMMLIPTNPFFYRALNLSNTDLNCSVSRTSLNSDNDHIFRHRAKFTVLKMSLLTIYHKQHTFTPHLHCDSIDSHCTNFISHLNWCMTSSFR